jgi:hypothetical protein
MTGSSVTRRFIVGEWRITRSLSSGAHSRDPLAHPPYALLYVFVWRRTMLKSPQLDSLTAFARPEPPFGIVGEAIAEESRKSNISRKAFTTLRTLDPAVLPKLAFCC